MKNEFVLAFNEVLEEKKLPREIILAALESAMVSAYRRAVNASTAQEVTAKIDSDTGKVLIFAEKEVVEQAEDDRTEVSLVDAKKVDPSVELGQMLVVESTPKDFGRVAAQTARQVIQQRIRDAERQAQLDFYQKQLGEIVSGIVQATNSQGLTIGLELRAEGSMARKDMIPGERFRIHDRVRSLIAEVKDSPRGPQIVLSRTHRDFLRRLLENEVPEIYHGIVEIRSISREPGERAKVAVSATQSGIDPVGACVGIRGVRIQTIVRELHDEKIDVIEWNPDPAVFISKAISPARVSGVYLNEADDSGKTATVVVPEDQLSLAIGRDGQNARLAAKLTGWRIDIKSVSEAAGDAVRKLRTEEDYAEIAKLEIDNAPAIEAMLAKRAEGRVLAPEDFDQMTQFVDRIERKMSIRRKPVVKREEDDVTARIRSELPAYLFEKNILVSGLPEHVAYILQEAGYQTLGDLVVQVKSNPDEILKLQGIGPRAMTEINNLMAEVLPIIDKISADAAKAEEEPVVEVEAEVETLPEADEVPAVEAVVEPEAPAAPFIPFEDLMPEAAVAAPVAEPVEEEPAEEISFDQLFSSDNADIAEATYEEEEEEEEVTTADGTTKKKKKKKKSREVEFDPEANRLVVKKKHKRGDDAWDWEI